MNAQSKAALKLFAHEQLPAGKHVIWEGATFDKQDKLFDLFPQFHVSKVWWCALGLPRNNSARKMCQHTLTASAFEIPAAYTTCCGKDPTNSHVGNYPRRVPNQYYVLAVKLIYEALTVQRVSEEILVESTFPTNAAVRRKQKAAGEKTLTAEDGPGEHEDIIPLKPC